MNTTDNRTASARTAPGAAGLVVWRQHRLARGWEPVQMIGRLRLAARRDGHALPRTYVMVRQVFEWESRRTPIPESYAMWLARIFEGETRRGLR
jgi:hypothetical protein